MLYIQLMGEPRISFESRAVDTPARFFQILALLHYSKEHKLSRRHLSQTIWDSPDVKTALNSLRQFLFRLAKFERLSDVLIVDASEVRLNTTAAQFDLSLLNQKTATLDSLASFWSGPFLNDPTPVSDAFHEWLIEKRIIIEDVFFRLAQTSLKLETFPGHATPHDVFKLEEKLFAIDQSRTQSYHALADAYGRLGAISDLYRIHDLYRAKHNSDEPKLELLIRRWASAKTHEVQDRDIQHDRTVALAIIVQKENLDPLQIAPFAMDLVSALARNRSFRTLAPIIRPASWIEDDATQATAHSDFSLILHHSSQKPAKTIGLNLVRMSDRAIIWSDYFNPNQFGINVRVTELLDHISENVTAHLHLFIKSISRLTQDNRVYERYLAEQALMEKADLASIRRARSVLKGIHHNDLGYSETSAGIGFTLLHEWKLLGGSDPSLIDSAHYFATQSINTFPHSPPPFIVNANAAIHKRDFDNALPALEEARKIFPNSPRLALEYADTLSHLDQRDDAWNALQLALSMHTEMTNHQLWTAASVALFSRHYDAAKELCERITSDEIALGVRTASHALAGDIEGARHWTKQFKLVLPGVTIDQLIRTTPFATKEAFEPYIEGLKMMGID